MPTIRNVTDSFLADSSLNGGLTGNAAIQVDSTNAYNKAEVVITIATIALIVVLLGLIFRSPIICVLPLVIIGAVHEIVSALVADLADAFGFQVGQIIAPVLVVVLFGVGTDYIVFLLFRYGSVCGLARATGTPWSGPSSPPARSWHRPPSPSLPPSPPCYWPSSARSRRWPPA